MEQKETVTTRLQNKNEAILKVSGAHLYQGHARFVAVKVVEESASDESIQLTAETIIIIINTGAKSLVLSIPGLLDMPNVYDSKAFRTWRFVLASRQLSALACSNLMNRKKSASLGGFFVTLLTDQLFDKQEVLVRY